VEEPQTRNDKLLLHKPFSTVKWEGSLTQICCSIQITYIRSRFQFESSHPLAVKPTVWTSMVHRLRFPLQYGVLLRSLVASIGVNLCSYFRCYSMWLHQPSRFPYLMTSFLGNAWYASFTMPCRACFESSTWRSPEITRTMLENYG